MEPLYAVRSTYNEAMYMSQVLASTPTKNAVKKKKGFQFHISGQTWCDLLALIVLFGAFYLLFGQFQQDARVSQSLMSAVATWAVLKYTNRNRKKTAKPGTGAKAQEQKRQAQTLLMNSGLSGTKLTIRFYDDEFEVENSGSLTSYRYEGIAWIKETADYIVIFWNQSLAIPVEKAGFYRGRAGQLLTFLEKRCGKTIEKVRSYEEV